MNNIFAGYNEYNALDFPDTMLLFYTEDCFKQYNSEERNTLKMVLETKIDRLQSGNDGTSYKNQLKLLKSIK